MAVKINTQTGMIEISNDVIATVVGGAVTDVFGIVGMASKNQIKDDCQLRHEDLRSIAQCPRKSEIQFGNDAWGYS